MELTPTHQAQISRYFAFFKGKRERHLKELEAISEDVKDDRCSDDVYNRDDVRSIMDSYCIQVSSAVKEELEKVSNLSAVYVSQLLAQAQAASLTLETDISLIEDQGRIEQIKELASMKPGPPVPKRGPLPQLNAQGYSNDPALLQECQDLKEENRKMADRFQQMQAQTTDLLRERASLSGELEKVKENFKRVRAEMAGAQLSAGGIQEIENSLGETKKLLDDKKQECEQMRQDLKQRLGDSAQFRELKTIIAKKNQMIKELRARLGQYEVDETPAADDD